jgi:ABC-type antimicrobial peptide transport system permease subunit
MKFFRFLGNEILLGTLIALLSVFTAISSYQGALADGEQNNFELLGMQRLNDGNAEYLRANQDITQDYNYFDNWYLNKDERSDIAEYYQSSFSQPLLDAIDRNPDTVWDEKYYTDMYVEANQNFDDSDANFELGAQWNERGDQLQLVLMIMALGLAFAAWASLMKEDNHLRPFFGLFSILALIIGVITYLNVPVIAG